MVAPPFYIDASGRLGLMLDRRGPLAVRAQGTLDLNVGGSLHVVTGSPPRVEVVEKPVRVTPNNITGLDSKISAIATSVVEAAAAATPPAADGSIVSNISGAPADPQNNQISAVLDYLLGTARGSIMFRGAAGWTVLAPGTAGSVLTTNGPGADPSWFP